MRDIEIKSVKELFVLLEQFKNLKTDERMAIYELSKYFCDSYSTNYEKDIKELASVLNI